VSRSVGARDLFRAVERLDLEGISYAGYAMTGYCWIDAPGKIQHVLVSELSRPTRV
jgi:hypothetical protein